MTGTQDRDEREQELHETAERTSKRIQPDDPYTEPPNSTVDDWFGQRVEHDMERADAQRDRDAPGAFVDDEQADAVPEPNEPA